ncbi:sigma-54 dependent transcriptional regulator [Rheinheimera soli]|uniref:DNA-binding NtrC family response regulator n=1 Tax=Rheinheimera soli TaxID=443616 RepID=A0ABU1W4B4_9GAMM|nr:sigma-54 dependent transcriptional regulator [Rheinheimera soli]MDR7122817.1 DNA-binding NtrC family response regulator [Rheinheimera soli]
MSQPLLFLHVQDPELTTQLLQSDIVRRFVICKSQPDECWVEQMLRQSCDLALIEMDNPAPAQYELLQQSHVLSEIDFILISKGIPDLALDQLMRCGAGYHFRQPLDMNSVLDAVQDCYRQLSTVVVKRKVQTSDLDQFGLLVGSSAAMLRLYKTVRKVAVTEANVFIIGESGAGKELVANTVHLASHRADKPFVAINCGALSSELIDSELFGHVKGSFTGALRDHQGVFAQAEQGTLFLDEVTEMPLEQQVKLLRVLESGEYRPVGSNKVCMANVRVIAATNRDPLQAVADGILREDLYFRLSQFPVKVPPLREREADITGLAQHFLAYCNAREKQQKQLSDAALSLVAQHKWPGNVRELKHAVERAFIMADKLIEPHHLLLEVATSVEAVADIPADMPLDELEKAAIFAALERNCGNKTDTAQQLGISVKTLYNKLEKYQQES